MALRLELLHECWDVLDTLVDLGPIRAFRCFPCRKFDAASRRGLYVAGGPTLSQPQLGGRPFLRFFLIAREGFREPGKQSVNSRLLAKIGDDTLF